MSQPIYKMYKLKWKEAWYELSSEERQAILTKVDESFARVGGKNVLFCDSSWSSESWLGFGVEEYPSVEAAQQHSADLARLNWFRYAESDSVLGTKQG